MKETFSKIAVFQYSLGVQIIKSMFFFLVSFLTTALPIYTRYEYRCETCKQKFNFNE
ncbi:hypothetical protein JM83_1440 [Gillisia sp. Hel_I_86]|uniref:hypothetical protein n=1 Tax=Gillisia sp. Hel_I_86 TaxID=1249981 RepID=UPI0011996B3E|nr:hypothetical protein [Gillisia sp. Hel_I_86]TVZ26481.1 hypothetical protein JM83_1440 [Gillisia sp. Hel_I_86]